MFDLRKLEIENYELDRTLNNRDNFANFTDADNEDNFIEIFYPTKCSIDKLTEAENKEIAIISVFESCELSKTYIVDLNEYENFEDMNVYIQSVIDGK